MINEQIRKLKEEGLSLRVIAGALNVSHEALRKRLKSIEGKNRVSTDPEDQLKESTIEKKKMSTHSKAHKSKTSWQPTHTVNRVSTLKTLSHALTEGVNPLETLTEQPTRGKKGVSHGIGSGVDDLFGAIKEFLESKGIEVYPMQNGGYQVKGNREIVRFYITCRDSVKEETR